MQVSFIIPLFNCLPLTQAMLTSLRETLPAGLAHEIIFVDDGSTDGTRSWLETLPTPTRVILNEKNQGFAATCNRGAAVATGEFLFFLNNDLVLQPGWFEPMHAGFARLPRSGIIGNVQLRHADRTLDHAGLVVSANGKPVHLKTLPSATTTTPGYAAMPAVTGACFAIPRGLFAQLGVFDEEFKNGGEDVDLCFRARQAGRSTWTALQSVVLHHVSASPGRNLRNEENSYRLFRRWRDVFEREAWRAWCETFLADAQAGRLPRHPRAEKAAADFLAGVTPRPGRWAESNVSQNLHAEESRWEQLLHAGKALAAPHGLPLS
ncbi:MAG: glycosyltransferase family 2 protein [Opitutae bacterium]|nr:glycosyltransferase family 2 protein [Opitutae bacterium]